MREEGQRILGSYRRYFCEGQSFYCSEAFRRFDDESWLTSLPSIRFWGQKRSVRLNKDLLKRDSFADVSNRLILFECQNSGEGDIEADVPKFLRELRVLGEAMKDSAHVSGAV